MLRGNAQRKNKDPLTLGRCTLPLFILSTPNRRDQCNGGLSLYLLAPILARLTFPVNNR